MTELLLRIHVIFYRASTCQVILTIACFIMTGNQPRLSYFPTKSSVPSIFLFSHISLFYAEKLHYLNTISFINSSFFKLIGVPNDPTVQQLVDNFFLPCLSGRWMTHSDVSGLVRVKTSLSFIFSHFEIGFNFFI